MTTRKPFSAGKVMDQLTDFQRNTAEYVVDRFYGDNPTDRFLVADETGLGKTIVARGVIARTIEKLQNNDAVDRIDIVYVCSNQDLAHQNLRKLNVTGDDHHGIASRLTLLSKHAHSFAPSVGGGSIKPVNLVSFTPGTSFSTGWQSGTADERALLFKILDDGLTLDGSRAENCYEVLRGSLQSKEGLRRPVRELNKSLHQGPDRELTVRFLAAIAVESLSLPGAESEQTIRDELDDLLDHFTPSPEHRHRAWGLVGRLRAVLARESIQLLTPDLVILDEFQRFRELLDDKTEAGGLAGHLFGYRDEATGHRAKSLLLSATPFKAFTFAEEALLGDDHHEDFLQLVRFLNNGDANGQVARIRDSLREYRDEIVTGRMTAGAVERARNELLRLMVRTERPRDVVKTMTDERVTLLGAPSVEDLLGFIAMKDLAREVGAPFRLEYWKSAPYFVNFMDGYKLGGLVREALSDPQRQDRIRLLLASTQQLNAAALDGSDQVDLGNPRMRALAAATVNRGWWRLLWVPPSLPYFEASGPYADPDAQEMSKLLVFSSWAATPAAVASLLSHQADHLAAGSEGRSLAEDQRARLRNRLAYRLESDEDERPSSMSTLALFWPMPGLARLADPLQAARHSDGLPVLPDVWREQVVARLETDHRTDVTSSGTVASHWYEAMRRQDSLPEHFDLRKVLAAFDLQDDQGDDPQSTTEAPLRRSRQQRHVELALQVRGKRQDRRLSPEGLTALAEVAIHSPANIAYRALSRIADGGSRVSDGGRWVAAVRLAGALRSLFSRPEAILLLDQLLPGSEPYWRRILTYCAWGNLQATLDEYAHHLHVSLGSPEVDDELLLEIARMASVALEMRSSTVEIFDPAAAEAGFKRRLATRFALRFGGRREKEESARQPVVRQAFNSPFQPFVLATTSIGQEGVDFHWWSRSVFHWNAPPNPIDFEQREGRVDRYDGLAVRRNLAARHGDEARKSVGPNPWAALYALADRDDSGLGSFAPHWVYPGDHRIERHVAPYALSTDERQLENVKRDVALYRLTFGQPRQEDMLALMKSQFPDGDAEAVELHRIDLAAPAWRSEGES
ncbi:helicase [Tessaracoccus antarcticus]|uniref:helicase n=1 Tax=Tessaracoccus antarcticus TaxID=2479848 RepID=UPI001313F188|nr:helicase [Tessaracoccus antarcticus]